MNILTDKELLALKKRVRRIIAGNKWMVLNMLRYHNNGLPEIEPIIQSFVIRSIIDEYKYVIYYYEKSKQMAMAMALAK